MSILGTRVVRTEDPRLLTAGGAYVNDLRVPELLAAARATFVRSPVAHALITGLDLSAARAAPGVLAVFTAQDMDDLPPPPPDDGTGSEGAPVPMGGPWAEPLLARDRVRFAGEPVAVVLTGDSYQGEDAAELVSVDYEPLPAVVGFAGALDPPALLFPGTDSNMAVSSGPPADRSAFDRCDVVISHTIENQRLAPAPLEGRAAAARWSEGRLTVWLSTQNAQISRFMLAGALGLDPAAIRVITPDVGGGFGAKVGLDLDGITVAWAARRTGRPVRWTETRRENLLGMTHGRAQQQAITLGGTRDGHLLAYRLEIVQDTGAYPRMGGFLPGLTSLMAVGPYRIPHVETAFRVVVTNTTPVSAHRGAGRPEATAAIERAVDLFAAEIGMDPAEVRRRNLIPAGSFPYATASGAVYDSGDYVRALDAVLAGAGYAALREEQARRRERGDVLQLGQRRRGRRSGTPAGPPQAMAPSESGSGATELPRTAAIAAADSSRTPMPIALSSMSNAGWWMSKSSPDPGTRVPSRAREPGTDSRYQAKSSPPRLCWVEVTASGPSTCSAAADSSAVLDGSFTVGGTLRW